MPITREIGFLISAIATALILFLVPVDESTVAHSRLEAALNLERTLKEDIAARCTKLVGRADSSAEQAFIARFAPAQVVGEESTCAVTIESASTNRFFLRTYWNYLIRITGENGHVFFERNFPVQLPRPLALLPIALFLLALLFEFTPWGVGCTIVSYLFCLGGASAIRATDLAFKSALVTLSGDTSFLGVTLILLWLALFLSRRAPAPLSAASIGRKERFVNQAFTLVTGLWSPSVFSLLGRLFSPVRGTVSRISPFLDMQIGLACLSLYFLTLSTGSSIADITEKSLLLPRYFSFSALLFLALTHYMRKPRREVSLYRQPRLWLALLFVLAVECLSLAVKPIAEMPTLLRVGAALCVSELVAPKGASIRKAASLFFPWVRMAFLASLVAAVSQASGVIDLALALAAPQIHPIGFVFFTFLAGLVLGFLTGNFATPFFTLLLMVKAHEVPQARAALLDGILAGTLLSPFSLHNLMPSVQFRIPLHKLIAFRWKQLAFPLAIGSTIYLVSAVDSVAILEPVTFVFLCLVVVAFQLKKRTWSVGSFREPEFQGN